MSTYITAEGTLKYEKLEDFLAARKILEDGGWLKHRFFRDECGHRISDDPDVVENERAINIPFALHRNLGWVLTPDKVLKGNSGTITWACTDGVCQGGDIVGEKDNVVNLEEWAKENGYSDPPATDAEDDEENQQQWDNYATWLNDVEMGFMGKD
jgi:hypothetical protein